MSVHQCTGCEDHFCVDCDGISECQGCGGVYCDDCMYAHRYDPEGRTICKPPRTDPDARHKFDEVSDD